MTKKTIFMNLSLCIITIFMLGSTVDLNSVYFEQNINDKIRQKRSQPMKHEKVTIYTTSVCPYCVRAKKLLESKGVQYMEIDVSSDSDKRLTMIEKAGGRSSVPQIFIGESHVGGADDLYALESEGRLDKLLKLA